MEFAVLELAISNRGFSIRLEPVRRGDQPPRPTDCLSLLLRYLYAPENSMRCWLSKHMDMSNPSKTTQGHSRGDNDITFPARTLTANNSQSTDHVGL